MGTLVIGIEPMSHPRNVLLPTELNQKMRRSLTISYLISFLTFIVSVRLVKLKRAMAFLAVPTKEYKHLK